MEQLNFVMENWGSISLAAFAGLFFAECIVRITPTKKDDGAVERVGKIIKRVFDTVKIPNNIKK